MLRPQFMIGPMPQTITQGIILGMPNFMTHYIFVLRASLTRKFVAFSYAVRIAIRLFFLLAVFALTGCADKKLTGKRIDLEGFSSAARERYAPSDGLISANTIVLPARSASLEWEQPLFSPLHSAPHFSKRPLLRPLFTMNIKTARDLKTPLQAVPIIADGKVFALNGNGVVFSFDAASGREHWRQELHPRQIAERKRAQASGNYKGREKGFGGGLAFSRAAVDGGESRLVISLGSGAVYALAPQDGRVIWSRLFEFPLRSAPIISDERIFIITPMQRSYALSLSTGDLLWQHQSPNYPPAQLTSAPPVASVGRYAIFGYGDGSLFALDSRSGRVLWKSNLTFRRRSDALADILDISAPPVIMDGVVYATGYSGKTAALDLASGTELWSLPLSTSGWLAVFGNAIFAIDNQGVLSAFSRASGKVIWERQLRAYMDKKKRKRILWNGPLLMDGTLLVSGSNGDLLLVDSLSGEVLTSKHFNTSFLTPPISANGLVYILDRRGKIHALK